MNLHGGKAPLVDTSADWLRPKRVARRRRRSSRNAESVTSSWRPAQSARRWLKTAVVCAALLVVMAIAIFLVLERA